MLAGKNVWVVGSGISGIGAVSLLDKMGAMPILFDENEKIIVRLENEIAMNFVKDIERWSWI